MPQTMPVVKVKVYKVTKAEVKKWKEKNAHVERKDGYYDKDGVWIAVQAMMDLK